MTRKTIAFSLVAFSLSATLAAAQNVTIVYPVDGETYPKSDPAPGGLSSSYFTSSFSVTCPGGPYPVEWGFDGTPVGQAEFYDMISAQQVWKLPGGGHEFYVDAGRCGRDRVKFAVGN